MPPDDTAAAVLAALSLPAAAVAAASVASLLTGPVLHRLRWSARPSSVRPPSPSTASPTERHRGRLSILPVRTLRRRWHEPSVGDQFEAVAAVCAATAAELRAGRRREEALQVAVTWTSGPVPRQLRLAAGASTVGGDIATTLRGSAAATQGKSAAIDGAVRALAACWEATGDTGAGLAVALDRLAGALRASAAHRREVAAELAGPQATARLLAALPVLGVLLGIGLGGDPVGFLVGSPVGLSCLAGGVLLEALGLVWTRHIIGRAVRG